jgi:hypothetical protein
MASPPEQQPPKRSRGQRQSPPPEQQSSSAPQPAPKRSRGQRQSPSPVQQPTPTPSPPAVVPGGGSLCQRCGTQNALAAHYCMNCGNSLPSASGPPIQTTQPLSSSPLQHPQSPARKSCRESILYPLLVAIISSILTLAFTLGVQWFLGPQDESTIIQLMDQEARIATTHTGSLADIYDAQATVIDAGCQTPGQGVVWSGLAQITDRYNHLGQFTSLQHSGPQISWEPNNRWATKAYVSATTIGGLASGPIHGNERWTFDKINGRWFITSFTYNFCQP